MPNHCGTTLRIVLPMDEDRIDSLVHALEGPSDWFFPCHVYSNGRRPASAHEQLTALQAAAGVDVAALRDEVNRRLDRVGAPPVPDWMPLCLDTARQIAKDPDWIQNISHVPLSFPHLLGPVSRDLATAWIKGLDGIDPDVLLVPETLDTAIGGDIIAIRTSLVGTKWGAYDIAFDPDEDVVRLHDRAVLTYRYTTAWGPISSIEEAFHQVLLDHDARLLLWWDDGGGSYGAAYLDPAVDVFQEWSIDLSPRDLDEEEGDATSGLLEGVDPTTPPDHVTAAPDADGSDGDDVEDDGDDAFDEDDGQDPYERFYERLPYLLEEKALELCGDAAFQL